MSEELTEEAKIAHQAYKDMTKSKKAFSSLRQELDIKYKDGGAPSIAENLQLEKLLGIHDKNVLAFNTAMSAVKDTGSRKALIKLMS